MPDTETVAGAPDAVRSWGSMMKSRKKSKGMWKASGGYDVGGHAGHESGSTMGSKTHHASAKKKAARRHPEKPIRGY